MEKEAGVNPLAENPYVGPRTYTVQESHLFFGRENEARDLISLVTSEHIVLFYAQSGAGKSSLINTRLVPVLQKKGFEVLPVGRVSGAIQPDEPVDNIFIYNLVLSLDQSKRDPQRFYHLPLHDFLTHLNAVDAGYQYIAEPAGGSPEAQAGPQAAGLSADAVEIWPRALIIDQFEELFTTHPEAWERREDFFRQLAAALEADPYLWIVLTMREDHVAALDPYAALLPGRLRARYYMQRMGRPAALEAVRLPVAELRPFAPGVAELLVDNLRLITSDQAQATNRELVAGEFIEPVQLQVVCYQLWETLQAEGQSGEAQREITTQDLTRLAKGADLAQFVNQSLADFYEKGIAKVMQTPGLGISESQLRDWFSTRLITEAETRAFVYRGEEQTAGLANAAVNLLAAQHIIRSEIRAGGVWIELVHDRLINPILLSNRLWQRDRLKPLTQAAEAWMSSGKDKLKLYEGNQLNEAMATTDRAKMNDLEIMFLDESLKISHSRRNRQRNIILASAVLVFLVMAILTTYALTQGSIAFVEASRAAQQANLAVAESTKGASAAELAIVESTNAARQANLAGTEAANARTQEARSKIQEAIAIKAVGEVQQQINQQQTIIPMYRDTITASQKLISPTIEIPTPTRVPFNTPTTKGTSVTPATPIARATSTSTPLPSDASQVVIGRSAKGIELRVVKVGKGERSVLVIGGLHAGFAPSSVRVAQAILDYYTRNPRRIPTGTSLHILVNANPDSPTKPGELAGRLNANQVDLSTNADCNWVPKVNLFDTSLSAGRAPFSEPELLALRDYAQKILPAAAISYEAKSSGLIYPGGCQGKFIFSMPLARVYSSSSEYKVTGSTGSDNGDFMDWLDSQGTPAIAVLLTDYTSADSAEIHIKAIQAVLEWNGK